MSAYRRPRILRSYTLEIRNGCWIWPGGVNSQGYAQVRILRQRKAHRVTFELLRGPIPDGLTLDHLCRVRNCANPSHLEPVTNWENIRRGISPIALNSRKTKCPKGHEYSSVGRSRNRAPWRTCRECNRAAWRKYGKNKRARLRAQVSA